MIRTVEHRERIWRLDDANRHVSWLIDNLPTWERDTFDAIDTYVHGGVFVDVGAWCGIFSLYASLLAERVIAVEPDPVALELLHRNLELNDVRNVTVVEGAVWSEDGTLELSSFGDEWADSMTGHGRGGSLKLAARCVSPATLKAMFDGDADLVKVDVEGAETEIMPGLLDWYVPMHVSLHLAEMSGPIDWQGRRLTTLVDHPSYPTVMVL